MTLEEVYHIVPQLKDYLTYMPEEYKKRLIIKVHPSGYIIHQKDSPLDYFGIVASGEHRVINEFENGNIFMIEKKDVYKRQQQFHIVIKHSSLEIKL